ncbi:MAG: aldehyde dehydrogenase, partial [Candidatus Bathyarchaeia archaeon]
MSELVKYQMFINGKWVDSASLRTSKVMNPYTGNHWAEVPAGDLKDVDLAVEAARQSFDSGPWSKMTGADRRRLLTKLGDQISENAQKLAESETLCNGKLMREMISQMKSLPEWYYYYAGWADKLQGETIPLNKAAVFNYTIREPLGVIAGVTPWNSPLLLLTFKLAPALATGNTFVLKPSSHTPVSALEFAKLVENSGFPPGVFNVVTGSAKEVGAPLISHPSINKIAFTGATDTGKAVLRTSAENLVRVTLELGGKSPNIVFDDAEVDKAVNGVISGIFAATGQTCVAGSRVLLHSDIKEQFLDGFAKRASSIKLGDPMNMETEMGPVAFREQLEKIRFYVDLGVREGGTIIYGGKQPDDASLSEGLFYMPTIIEVKNDMKIAQEEIFGPVASIIEFKDEDQAVRIANESSFGLAAGLWTTDIRRAHRVAHRLKAGTVWINMYRSLSTATPFGGYKQSGIGRENSYEAIKEYTQVKSVWVELSGESRDPFKLG